MSLAPGSRLDAYELVRPLGAGGMGEVWLAGETSLGRKVALKLLPADLTQNAARVTRFEQEARAASALNHPNVCTIYALGRSSDGRHYIAMEYVEGETLRDRLSRARLTVRDLVDIGIQVASALTAAHGAGIFHRDIKPENVMIRPDGIVKVLDFGLAKLTAKAELADSSPTRTAFATEVGAILGTVGYMSPEQVEGRPVDARSDVFAFGSMLYEMACGRRAFVGDSAVATLAAILEHEPAPLPAALPDDLRRVVSRCLRKRPDQRYQHMADVRIELEEIRDARAGQSSSSELVARRRRAWAAGGSVLLVLALGGVAWLARRGDTAARPPLDAVPVPLTSDAGFEESPSFSPDGSQVAYSCKSPNQDNYDICLKLIGAPNPLRLTTNAADDLGPAFSPDGRSVGFVRVSRGRRTYVVTPALGGSERTVAELPPIDDDPTTALGSSTSSSWLPDGTSVVLDGLSILSLETGELRDVVTGTGRRVSGWYPAVAPDGRALAFTRPSSLAAWGLYVLTLSEDGHPNGEPVKLAELDGDVYGLTWTADSRELIYASGELSGDSGLGKTLWRIRAVQGAQAERLALGQDVTSPAASRHGARVAFVRNTRSVNIWRATLPDTEGLGSAAERFVSSTLSDWNPQFSPDGSRLAFESNRTGQSAVWVSEADGSNIVEVFSRAGKHAGTPRWSPDSQQLAFDSSAEGHFDIYTMRLGSRQPLRLTTEPSDDVMPSWSPDGRWIYFASNRSGSQQVWKVPASGGAAVQVTRHGGACVFPSADGARIYYTKTDGDSALWSMPVEGGSEREVLPSIVGRNFSVFEDGVYFIPRASAEGRFAVHFLSFSSGAATPVVTLAGPASIGLTVSRDRRQILYAQSDSADRDLMLLDGFR